MSEKAWEQYLVVARIVRPQGRRGEVAAEILTDFPERLVRLQRVFLAKIDETPELFQLENAWPHKGRMILKFLGVDSRSQAEMLRGREVLLPRGEKAPLGRHQYYTWELCGCQVFRARRGEYDLVGVVTEVEPTGGVPLLSVETPGGDVLVPLAQEICTTIDTEAKRIIIDPPEDLLALNTVTDE